MSDISDTIKNLGWRRLLKQIVKNQGYENVLRTINELSVELTQEEQAAQQKPTLAEQLASSDYLDAVGIVEKNPPQPPEQSDYRSQRP